MLISSLGEEERNGTFHSHFYCLGFGFLLPGDVRAPLWAADDPSEQLADVTKIEKIEIRSVNPGSGIAIIEIDLNLEGKSNVNVTQVALWKFYIDNVPVIPQP